MTTRFVDLFCGIGGFHSGIVRSIPNAQLVFACDIDPACCKVYHDNYQFQPNGDIKQISVVAIPPHDILFAGFPCQPFSSAGQMKAFDDERTIPYRYILKILQAKQPVAFVLENVENIIKIDAGSVIRQIKADLEELGYKISYSVLNTYDFGLPQNRTRAFIVGHREITFNFAPLLNIHNRTSLDTVLEADACEYIDPSKYTLLPVELRKTQSKSGLIFCGYIHGNMRTTGVIASRVHLSRNHKQPNRIYQSTGSHPTLSSSETSGRYYIYDGTGVRKLTVTEMYRLMGYPDSLLKHPTRTVAIRHIGNSVSPTVVSALIDELRVQGLI